MPGSHKMTVAISSLLQRLRNNGANNQNASRSHTVGELLCQHGEHDFDNPPGEDWQMIGLVVMKQKRYVQCQRPECGHRTTQVRDRKRFDIHAPYGPWRDAIPPDLDLEDEEVPDQPMAMLSNQEELHSSPSSA